MRPRKTSGNNSLSKEADPLLSKEPESISKISVVKELINELHVYQAELKVQNEELLRVKSEFKAYENRFRKLSLSKAMKLYWKYYLPFWLFPIYFYFLGLYLKEDWTLKNGAVLFLIPFFVTSFLSMVPFLRRKISLGMDFLLRLPFGILWVACVYIGLIMKWKTP